MRALSERLGDLARAAWLRLTDRRLRLSRPPIFIVGCGHSGTTVLCALLARHPGLNVLPFESNAFSDGRSYRHVGHVLGAADDPDAGRLVEKTPSHVLSIRRILRLFPEARIVGVVRDGRDVAASLRKRSGKLDRSVRRWVDCSIALAQWRDDARVHVVRYEDLIADPETVLNGLLAFLGLAPDGRALLEAPESSFDWRGGAVDRAAAPADDGNTHLAQRRDQLNRGLYDGRGSWRVGLSADEARSVAHAMHDHLASWGYDPTDVEVSTKTAQAYNAE